MKIKENCSGKKRILVCFLVLILLAGFAIPGIMAQAKTVKIATVSLANATFRSTPEVKNGNEIGYLVKGDSGEVLAEATDSRPVLWYQIKVDGQTGWVSSACVTVTEKTVADTTVTPDGDFEAYLTAQGFPESYKQQLRELHAQYPNWIFRAQHVDYTWAEAIAEESKLGRNLIGEGSITSWKSTQNGAYDWATGKWKVFDSGGWVQTSQGMIEHYMDPRNFLDATNVFQFLLQSYDASTMTQAQIAAKKAELVRMVDGTYLEGNYTENGKSVSYVDTIMSVAAQTGVCPLTLASMMIQEQGRTGYGQCISGTVSGYEGYYNYFNIGAYKTSTMNAIQRGLWYASGSGANKTSYNRPWNTRTASILGGAMYYGKNYVNVGQDTMYLKKFNVQGEDAFSHQYMTNVQGAASEGKHIAEGYDATARQAALIFKIPVYEGMPQTACARPTGNKNPNYMLNAISVSGYSLTPTFDIYETAYAVSVPYSVSNVTISATAVASQTAIGGLGEKALNVGTNKFTINTTAENGATRTYTITVVRLDENGTDPSVSVSSSSYKMNSDSTLTGITSFPIKAANFISNISVTNGNVQVVNADGSTVSGNVGTGDQVRIYNAAGACISTYNVVIYGDANGDGIVNAKDLLVIQKNNIKVSSLSGVHLTAADVNRDGKVNAKDLLLVQKNNIKVSTIQQ